MYRLTKKLLIKGRRYKRSIQKRLSSLKASRISSDQEAPVFQLLVKIVPGTVCKHDLAYVTNQIPFPIGLRYSIVTEPMTEKMPDGYVGMVYLKCAGIEVPQKPLRLPIACSCTEKYEYGVTPEL